MFVPNMYPNSHSTCFFFVFVGKTKNCQILFKYYERRIYGPYHMMINVRPNTMGIINQLIMWWWWSQRDLCTTLRECKFGGDVTRRLCVHSTSQPCFCILSRLIHDNCLLVAQNFPTDQGEMGLRVSSCMPWRI
jgi:hypothetical protein